MPGFVIHSKRGGWGGGGRGERGGHEGRGGGGVLKERGT